MVYKIVAHCGETDCLREVRRLIRLGWQPLGGVSLSGRNFAQAMTNDKCDHEFSYTSPICSDCGENTEKETP